jgi:hypothetical protein
VSESALQRADVRQLVGKRDPIELGDRIFNAVVDAESPPGIAAEARRAGTAAPAAAALARGAGRAHLRVSAPRRLDAELVRRGLVETRAQAQEAVRAGLVTVDGAPALKPAPGSEALSAL